MADGLEHQLEKQALSPSSTRAGEISASLMQLSEGEINKYMYGPYESVPKQQATSQARGIVQAQHLVFYPRYYQEGSKPSNSSHRATSRKWQRAKWVIPKKKEGRVTVKSHLQNKNQSRHHSLARRRES